MLKTDDLWCWAGVPLGWGGTGIWPLVVGKDAVNYAARRHVAQAGVQFVSGLGRAAGAHILDDIGDAVQHHDHLAFELRWQNRLHIVAPRKCRNGFSHLLAAQAAQSQMARPPRRKSN